MHINHHSNLISGPIFNMAGKIVLTGKKAVRIAYNWRERQRLELLMRFDDARLDDLGVSRRDLQHVLALPLTRNPSCELERRRGAHRYR